MTKEMMDRTMEMIAAAKHRQAEVDLGMHLHDDAAPAPADFGKTTWTPKREAWNGTYAADENGRIHTAEAKEYVFKRGNGKIVGLGCDVANRKADTGYLVLDFKHCDMKKYAVSPMAKQKSISVQLLEAGCKAGLQT